MKSPSTRSLKVDLRISFIMLLKITGFAVLLAMVVKLIPLLSLCFFALLLALAVEPIIGKLERWVPRWLAITLLMSLLILVTVGFLVAVFPPLYEQASRIVQKIPSIKKSVLQHYPNSTLLKHLMDQISTLPTPNFESWSTHLVTFGQAAAEAVTSLVLVLVIMIYLLVDGKRTCNWVIAFFKPGVRTKIYKTSEEITPVISAYFVGQALTSLLCSIFVYIMLTSLNVPAALILAVLAGVFDILPVIGFFLSVIPAALFALTVSTETSLIVLGLYCIYHAIENYLIVPWVYGNRLRLSGFAVLLSILVGVALAGILGAIVILPVVASYPIIERIWLVEYLGRNLLEEHQKA